MIIIIPQLNTVGTQPHPTLRKLSLPDCLDKKKTSFRNDFGLLPFTECFIEHIMFEFIFNGRYLTVHNTQQTGFLGETAFVSISPPNYFPFHLFSICQNISSNFFQSLSFKLLQAPEWHIRKLFSREHGLQVRNGYGIAWIELMLHMLPHPSEALPVRVALNYPRGSGRYRMQKGVDSMLYCLETA